MGIVENWRTTLATQPQPMMSDGNVDRGWSDPIFQEKPKSQIFV